MSETPKRIQRKRTRGFNLQAASSNPNGVAYVGRPTKHGNPYLFIEDYRLGLSLELYENSAQGIWEPQLLGGLPDWVVETAYQKHQAWTSRFGRHPLDAIRDELSGYDLACWCRLDAPCHADILLKLAN